MSNIQEIDIYNSIGNSIDIINKNFQLFNNRMCYIDKARSELKILFSNINFSTPSINGLITTVNSNSALWRDTASLVYNTKGYWLEPVTLMYQKTFSVIANFAEIETWLDNTFSINTFTQNQILKVSYIVKNYDPSIINNTPLPNTTTASLDTLAAAYNQNTNDIQSYFSYFNHITSIIATINNIIKRSIQNIGLLIEPTNNVKAIQYFNSFSIFKNILSSNKLINFSQSDLRLIYSYLYQLVLINNLYQTLVDKGIPNIPATILNKFNLQKIYETFIGSFCFHLNNNNLWEYIPSCNIDFCVDQKCNCYDFIDVNSLYKNRGCPFPIKYDLVSC